MYGGDPTERASDAACVDKSLGAALLAASYLSTDGRTDPLHVASSLLFYLAKNHCFTDGNKRVSWAAAVECLLREGLQIVATTEEAASFVNRVASGECDRDKVLDWFAVEGRIEAYAPEQITPDRPSLFD